MSLPADSSLDGGSSKAAEQAWSVEEIDRLYRKALEAVDEVANDLNAATDALTSEAEPEGRRNPTAGVSQPTPGPSDYSESHPNVANEEAPVGAEQVIERCSLLEESR